MAYITFAALGLVFQGYFFSFHLLHVARDNDLLTRVLQAVTKNGKTLLWVALLTLIIIYIYSLIAYAFYRETYDPNDGLLCSTLFECLLTTLNFGKQHEAVTAAAEGALVPHVGMLAVLACGACSGLRTGGGAGDMLPLPPDVLLTHEDTFKYMGLRALYDLTFFIIISTIAMNIVFGIIVDTFSELRNKRYEIEADRLSSCFICSLRADEFERAGAPSSIANAIRRCKKVN